MVANRKLITCKHCGGEIARSAVFCPHCGGKIKSSPISGFFFLIGVIVQSLIGLLKFLIGLAFIFIIFAIFLTYTGNWSDFLANIQSGAITVAEYIEGNNDLGESSGGEMSTYANEPISDEDAVSTSFRSKMDSLEAFFNEYAEFMKKYNTSEDASSMLTDYTSLMIKYTDAMTELDSIDEDSLSDADYAYYTQVMLRITNVLIDVAGEMD